MEKHYYLVCWACFFLGFTFGDLYAWGEISSFNGEIRHATHERINNALAIDINQNFNVILTLPKCYMIGSRCLSSNVHIDLINHTNRSLLIRIPGFEDSALKCPDEYYHLKSESILRIGRPLDRDDISDVICQFNTSSEAVDVYLIIYDQKGGDNVNRHASLRACLR